MPRRQSDGVGHRPLVVAGQQDWVEAKLAKPDDRLELVGSHVGAVAVDLRRAWPGVAHLEGDPVGPERQHQVGRR